MTTIVWADGRLWADSRVTRGSYIVAGAVNKLVRLPDGRIATGAGLSVEIDNFIDWLANGKRGDAPPLTDGSVIVELQLDGSCVEYWDATPQRVEGDYEAWGSGLQFALGALAVGASPEQALLAACKHDAGTGEPICVGEVPGSSPISKKRK